MGYTGCKNDQELRTKAKFIRITSQGLRESHVHDVIITEEARTTPKLDAIDRRALARTHQVRAGARASAAIGRRACADEVGDTILLLEHDPVITLGAREGRSVLVDESARAARRRFLRDRAGGDVTYHGPGSSWRTDFGFEAGSVRRAKYRARSRRSDDRDCIDVRDRRARSYRTTRSSSGVWIDLDSPKAWRGDPREGGASRIGRSVRSACASPLGDDARLRAQRDDGARRIQDDRPVRDHEYAVTSSRTPGATLRRWRARSAALPCLPKVFDADVAMKPFSFAWKRARGPNAIA